MPDGSFSCDFVYRSHRIFRARFKNGHALPTAYGEDSSAETLEITMEDASNCVLLLYYTVFPKKRM